jgi:hypothetical protein
MNIAPIKKIERLSIVSFFGSFQRSIQLKQRIAVMCTLPVTFAVWFALVVGEYEAYHDNQGD